MLGVTKETVRLWVKKGEIAAHKKTLGRTSPFVIDRDSVLDFDRRRLRQQPCRQAAHNKTGNPYGLPATVQAPRVGLEPTTLRLTAACSAN